VKNLDGFPFQAVDSSTASSSNFEVGLALPPLPLFLLFFFYFLLCFGSSPKASSKSGNYSLVNATLSFGTNSETALTFDISNTLVKEDNGV